MIITSHAHVAPPAQICVIVSDALSSYSLYELNKRNVNYAVNIITVLTAINPLGT